MPRYRYKATNLKGRMISGVFEGTDSAAVIAMLRQKDYYPLEVEEAQEKRSGSIDIELSKKIPLHPLALFCTQLATVLRAGVPLVAALDMLRQQTEHKRLKAIINDVYDKIQTGNSLSGAFSDHAERFPDIFISMLEAGELSGNIDEVLHRMGITFEKDYKLKKKVKSALTYPKIISIFALIVVVGLLIFMVPTFTNLYASFDQALPGPTQLLLDLSSFIVSNWLLLLLLIAIIIALVKIYLSSPAGKLAFAKMMLRIPVFGKLNVKIVSARFTRTLSTLLSSGVALTSSLEVTARAVGNVVLEKGLLFTADQIQEGQSLSSALSGLNVFPPMVINMVQLGEESGTLESFLSKTADSFDSDAEDALSQMTGMIEPLVIIVMGGLVMFIALSMLLPMFTMYSF
ncbi:MAG: type II secretion system F family protein, partial [Christensenellales bacterium]